MQICGGKIGCEGKAPLSLSLNNCMCVYMKPDN